MSLLHKLISTNDKPKRRIGRGYGSQKGGHTSSRGTKGQKSRVGSKIPLWFEGGQLPLIKRLPMMRGKGKLRVLTPVAELNLGSLDKMKAEVISLETLKLEKKIDQRFTKAKVIAGGELTRAVTLQGIKVSKSARELIEKAGGKIIE
jgi:large subunit ribosomal protein L15